MENSATNILIVGEVYVDVTLTAGVQDNKVRLGGVVHAARGLWASNQKYSVAIYIPQYLEENVTTYLKTIGCEDIIIAGYTFGSPNVILITDPTEVDYQGYDEVLRYEKRIETRINARAIDSKNFTDAIIFPGKFLLSDIIESLSDSTRYHIDIAYDVDSIDTIPKLNNNLESLFLSTSSDLFKRTWNGDIDSFFRHFESLEPKVCILKENRGGSRVRVYESGDTIKVPAQLGFTVNSVGVGDVFDAAFVAYRRDNYANAAWMGALTSAAYAQTTDLDQLKDFVERNNLITIQDHKNLGGFILPWEARQSKDIYLAAPDFDIDDREPIDRTISALEYHNFKLRRPVREHGELPPNSPMSLMKQTYAADYKLLHECDLIFAIPLKRDPGTLVEIGIAINAGVPVVVFDPQNEAANTMVVGGADIYSQSLNECLNATFRTLGYKVEL